MDKWGYVYILASARHGTLYTGVTSDRPLRIGQHRSGTFTGFTLDHDIRRLVWFEAHQHIRPAILREKQIKKWRREWKINMIEAGNPDWRDLAVDLGFEPLPVLPARPFRTVAS